MAEAVEAYRKALEVTTLATLPPQWAQTQNNLAEVYIHLQDWQSATECYVNVLKVYPDYEKAYQIASYLYHEELFDFPRAFALNQEHLNRYPDDLSTLCDFAERHFTTGRFAECETRIGALLLEPDIAVRQEIVLRILEVANLVGLGDVNVVPNKIDELLELIATQPEEFTVEWTFKGTKHFISESEKLADHREWLLSFFNAIEGENRSSILSALREARGRFEGEAVDQ